jgi:hypothetical protein
MLTVFWVAAVCGAAPADGSLHKRVSVKYENRALAEVLRDLEGKTGVPIAPDPGAIQGQPPVTLEASDEAAGRILTRILRQRGLKVKSYDKSPLAVVRHNWYEPLVEKEETYEFAVKPSVEKLKNGGFAISFETKGFCDCTVAIENEKQEVVRHLASGVLGVNAPKEFVWNSKKQRVVWYGTDDRGRPVTGSFTARVSLGLKARLERTLFWSPHKRITGAQRLPSPSIVARPEGIYVFDGGFGDHLRLFDRDGKYVRAIFPPPADKVPAIKWPKLHYTSTPERPVPLKYTYEMHTILTQALTRYGTGGWPTGCFEAAPSCTAMAIRGTRVALAQARLNRLATDGSSGGLPLHGPDAWLPAPTKKELGFGHKVTFLKKTRIAGKSGYGCVPWSIAFSPDGKWLYATGYVWLNATSKSRGTLDALPVVTRLAYEGKKKPEPWVGSLNASEFGDGDKQFCYPNAVSVDGEGRVYVCDYMNGRVQVFSPEARLLGSLKTPYPTDVEIHPETGELFVFSWAIGNRHWSKVKGSKVVKPTLTRYGAFPKFGKKASWPLPYLTFGRRSRKGRVVDTAGNFYPYDAQEVAVDFWSNPPRLWWFSPKDVGLMRSGRGRITVTDWNVKAFALSRGTLLPVCDFAEEVKKETAFTADDSDAKWFVHVDPVHGNLWVRIGLGSTLIRIDPETGRESLVRAPSRIMDMAFDLDGGLYARTGLGSLVRYDFSDGGFGPGEKPKPTSRLGIIQLSGGNHGVQGLGVSPRGQVVVATAVELGRLRNPRERSKHLVDRWATLKSEFKAEPPPGRYGQTAVWVFDKDGKLLVFDGFQGAGWLAGARMDREGFVYAPMSGVTLVNGKSPRMPNRMGCTLMKFTPGEARIFGESFTTKPVPKNQAPKRPKEFGNVWRGREVNAWLEGVEWQVPEVGISGNKTAPRCYDHGCICRKESRFDLDLYARSFCSEVHKYQVCVVDSNGNRMLTIGRMGNVDDGLPLAKGDRVPNPRKIGGDEVAIAHCMHVAVHTDNRLFISDVGNTCIRSVKLSYHAEQKVPLPNANDVVK